MFPITKINDEFIMNSLFLPSPILSACIICNDLNLKVLTMKYFNTPSPTICWGPFPLPPSSLYNESHILFKKNINMSQDFDFAYFQ